MQFHDVTPISRNEAEAAFASGNEEKILDALIRLAFHEPDWKYVQEKCLALVKSSSAKVRGLAVTCLGHLARIHGKLEVQRVLPVLRALKEDREVSGRVANVLEDFAIYLPGFHESTPSDG